MVLYFSIWESSNHQAVPEIPPWNSSGWTPEEQSQWVMPDVSKLVEVVGSLSVVAPESCGRPGVMNFRCPRWGPRCDSHGAGICTATMDWVMERVNVWVNYNDLTATSLKSWLIREIIPKWPYFRLVKYYNLPRNVGIHIPAPWWANLGDVSINILWGVLSHGGTPSYHPFLDRFFQQITIHFVDHPFMETSI